MNPLCIVCIVMGVLFVIGIYIVVLGLCHSAGIQDELMEERLRMVLLSEKEAKDDKN
jgi:hypothetical protein